MDPDDPQSLFGKSILVGVTYLDADGELEKRVQYFGVIRIEQMEWRPDGPNSPLANVPTIVVENEGLEMGRFPYDKRAICVAKPGVYRLRTTGVEITDPDLLAQWEVRSRNKASKSSSGSTNGEN